MSIKTIEWQLPRDCSIPNNHPDYIVDRDARTIIAAISSALAENHFLSMDDIVLEVPAWPWTIERFLRARKKVFDEIGGEWHYRTGQDIDHFYIVNACNSERLFEVRLI